MATTIGGEELKKCNVDGIPCKRINVNGTKVWSAEFYVYNAGTIAEGDTSITASFGHQGWYTTAVKPANVVFNNTNILLTGSGSAGGDTGNDNVDSAAWVIFNDVDLTDYSILSMTFDFTAVSGDAPAIIGVVDETGELDGAGLPQILTYLASNRYTIGTTVSGGSTVTNEQISCDVSKLTGKKKIVVMTYAGDFHYGYYSDLYVKSIKLE